MNITLLRSPKCLVTFFLATTIWFACPQPLNAQVDIITTVAGNGSLSSSGDGFSATTAGIPSPRDIALDATGTLYISSIGSIRRVLPNGIIDTFAVLPLPTIGGFPIPSQTFTTGITFSGGDLFAVQNSSIGRRIIRVDSRGVSSVFLDVSTMGFNYGDFIDVVLDAAGNLLIADSARHRVLIRRSAAGAPSVYAGRNDGISGFGGDGGTATSATLNTPTGLAIDGAGNVYIADSGNHRIRRVDSNGIITTVAGSSGPYGGFAGDGSLAANAQLNTPIGLVADHLGNLYIADAGNARVRRIDPQGIITTVAGSGVTSGCFADCYSGDGGRAILAQLSRGVQGLVVDSAGNLYIADTGNNRVRKVTLNASASQLPPPTIRSSGNIGVVNGASFEQSIASGSWVTIFGEHLAPILPPGRIWYSSEIVDGRLPTSLEGVSVRFNGKPGYLYFVGPNQLNVLAPDDLPHTTISVEVETPSGTATTNAVVREFAPALFGTVKNRLGAIYTAAVHLDGTVVGHPSLLPGSLPARRGETISLYGTGFGPTFPPRPAGELFSPAPLVAPYTVRVNGNRVFSSFGGIVSPGLYQFNITLLNVGGPDAFLEIEIGGQKTASRMILAVER